MGNLLSSRCVSAFLYNNIIAHYSRFATGKIKNFFAARITLFHAGKRVYMCFGDIPKCVIPTKRVGALQWRVPAVVCAQKKRERVLPLSVKFYIKFAHHRNIVFIEKGYLTLIKHIA